MIIKYAKPFVAFKTCAYLSSSSKSQQREEGAKRQRLVDAHDFGDRSRWPGVLFSFAWMVNPAMQGCTLY
jgi:hypothetical protein